MSYIRFTCRECGRVYLDVATANPGTCEGCLEARAARLEAAHRKVCRCCGLPTDPWGKAGFCGSCEPRLDPYELQGE
jgi:hypothetical protein